MPAESGSSLQLTPNDYLRFRFELRRQIPTTLTLTNPGSTTLAFKVKTTSPRKYCVRPNTGVVAAGGATEVQVIMQQQKEYPADFNNCKDKFLVQSVAVDAATADALAKGTKDYADLFAQTSGIAEAKLRVAFVQPAPPPSPVPEEGDGDDRAVSPAPFSTPAPQTAAGGGGDAGARHEVTKAQLLVETSEKNAAIADRARLQKELAETRQKYESLRTELSFSQTGKAAARAAVPFTLLHLLLTAILAFCLGRYT